MILTPTSINEAVRTLWNGRMRDAAAAMGCSERTLRHWIAGEATPTVRMAGAARRGIEARAHEMIERAKSFAA